MDVCRATKGNGDRCKLAATGQQGYCWHHAPENAEQRKKVASRGGKGKAARRTAALWDEVKGVISDIAEDHLTPPQGNTMLKGYSTLIALERLAVEQSELEIEQRRLELDEEERTVLKEDVAALKEAEERRRHTWGA
jgi:hypothetical protein